MWRTITFLIFSAAFLFPSGPEASVFYSDKEANLVLKIRKRANSFLEEIKPSSLERECYEERCDYEEAREIFQTTQATLDFWTKYSDGDQCESNPCINGTCRDGFQQYACICNNGWEGRQCDIEVIYTNCSIDNGGCEHFCNEAQTEGDHYRYCTCAPGYHLSSNQTTCESTVSFPCGKVVEPKFKIAKIIGGKFGKKGDSPWQVMLRNRAGEFKCGAVLIHPVWVLTAAHCVVGLQRIKLTFGKYFRRWAEENEQDILADKVLLHENYTVHTNDNDIALLHLAHPVLMHKFALPICLPSKNLAEQQLMREGTQTVVTGWGTQSEESRKNYSSVIRYIEIPVASRNECIHTMSNSITDNMFCAGKQGDNRDSCHGDSGGPVVTKFKNTWFLIGLVSWGEGCGQLDNFGIYTKVSSYLDWINKHIKT